MLVVVAFLLGLIVGSFLNVCIQRIPQGVSVIHPPSACPLCGSRIRWYDNVPVVSFVLLRGHCRSCGGPISWQYPAVEVATGLLFAAVARQGADLPASLFACAITCLLLVIGIVDLRHQIVPDVLTLPGIALAFVARMATHASVLQGIIGLLAGATTLFLFAWAYQRLTGRDGMGGGDIKLTAMVGAWLGWQGGLLVIFIASVAGSLVGLLLVALGRSTRHAPLPFGAFISPAAILLFLSRWSLSGGNIA